MEFLSEFLWWGGYSAALLFLYEFLGEALRRKKGRKIMAPKPLLFNERFDFAGHSFYAKIAKLDGYTIDMIRAQTEGVRPDHSQARLMLVHNSLEELSMDGTEISLKLSSSGRSKFPRVLDRETKETLFDRIVKIVCQRDPEIPLLMEETFGKYVEEEEVEEEVMTSSPLASVPSIPHSPEEDQE